MVGMNAERLDETEPQTLSPSEENWDEGLLSQQWNNNESILKEPCHCHLVGFNVVSYLLHV